MGLLILAVAFGPIRAATVNVTDHGAVPNDASSDDAAVSRAVGAAVAGDTVFFPNGVFVITNSIHPKSGLKLAGESQAGAIIQYRGASAAPMIDLSGFTSVEISSLTLDGNSNPKANGIYAYLGNGFNLHHLTIKDFTDTNGALGIHFNGNTSRGVTDSMISDNVFTNISVGSAWGGGIRCSWHSSRNSILRNTISQTGRGGIFADNGSTNLVIQGNTVSGSGMTAEGLGIEVWGGCDYALVEDNVIDHWLSVSGTSHCAVRRNIVRDLAERKIAFIGLEQVVGTDIIFTDNLVDHGQQIGISISGAGGPKDYIYWGFNTIQYMVQWGLQMQGETSDVNGAHYQYFYRNQFLNTDLNDPRAAYPGDTGHGFRFNGSSFYITLDSNVMRANGGHGIQFSGGIDNISVVGNTITGNGGAAATAYPGAALDLEWANNVVSGNRQGNTQPHSRGFGDRKPAASFSAVGAGEINQAVQFTNTTTDADSAIGHVLWDFGDGLPSNEMNPTHAYSKPGTYRVSLVAWDTQGRGARAEQMVTIAPPHLQITPQHHSALLTWPATATNWSLWMTSNLVPPVVWWPVTEASTNADGENVIGREIVNDAGFFRLSHSSNF